MKKLSLISRAEDERPVLSEFYIHAVLQAARAYHLGLDLNSAKSWGLNRAIFYEAAKNGYISRGARKPTAGIGRSVGGGAGQAGKPFGILYSVGREKAYATKTPGGGLRFVIGGKAQTPEAFDRQVRRRFPDWETVWREATKLINDADSYTLNSASRFHREIYKRHRADLALAWSSGKPAFPLFKPQPNNGLRCLFPTHPSAGVSTTSADLCALFHGEIATEAFAAFGTSPANVSTNTARFGLRLRS